MTSHNLNQTNQMPDSGPGASGKKAERSSGLLLHISALPSKYGIGDLGPQACRFADYLHSAGQRWWQILPLNPTNPVTGNSPYSSVSAFAANLLFISPEKLLEKGLLEKAELDSCPTFPADRVDYPAVTEFKIRLLRRAFTRFDPSFANAPFRRFCLDNAYWLDDYALYAALKESRGGAPWHAWPDNLKNREPEALENERKALQPQYDFNRFVQYIFHDQWRCLLCHCNRQGVRLMGDMPIYVDLDSADVWSHTSIFKLGENYRPEFVAGVPPDYFSKDGQRWGNPVYDWQAMKKDNYDWWKHRLGHTLKEFDSLRIDHFRGFIAYWEIPAAAKTAREGKWVKVDFGDFFQSIFSRFPRISLVAEDLGIITEEVKAAIAKTGLPGMKLLMFAFGEDSPKNPYLPENFSENCVVYTGNHDLNTARAWFEKETTAADRMRLEATAGKPVSEANVHIRLTEMALASKAHTAIIPIQDLLGLGEEARMNVPGLSRGNWAWRLWENLLTPESAAWLKGLTEKTGRLFQA